MQVALTEKKKNSIMFSLLYLQKEQKLNININIICSG